MFRFAKASSILRLERFPRLQDVDEDFEWFYSYGGNATRVRPQLVIFVSHRWETAAHPDPDCVQLESLKFLLLEMRNVLVATRSGNTSQDLLRMSLRRHGTLQTARILGGDWFNDNQEWQKFVDSPRLDPSSLLDHVGIWYDYLCLPQRNESGYDDRDERERGIVKQTLSMLERLMGDNCAFLSLRHRSDDYVQRAWCFFELVAGGNNYHHVVLRTDLLGQSFTDEDTTVDASTSMEADLHDVRSLSYCLDKWESGGNIFLLQQISRHYVGLKSLEVNRHVPFFITPSLPQLAPAQEMVISIMSQFLDEYDASKSWVHRDVGIAAEYALLSQGIKCTNGSDLVYIGLMTVAVREVHNTSRSIFRSALKRSLEGKCLVLTEYQLLETDPFCASEFRFEDGPATRYQVAWRQPHSMDVINEEGEVAGTIDFCSS